MYVCFLHPSYLRGRRGVVAQACDCKRDGRGSDFHSWD